jgi:predicted nucleic acid-binding protein
MTGSPVVIDASIAVKPVLPSPMRPQCRALISQLKGEGVDLVAPALWSYETTSSLCKAVHFGVATPQEGRLMFSELQALGVRLFPPIAEQERQAFEWTLRLRHAAAHDSFYLTLAETLGCDLWTADRWLCRAVDEPWVHCVGGR